MTRSPSPEDVALARTRAGLRPGKAAGLVHVSVHAWRKWENGTRPMNKTAWELFLIKTKQHPDYPRP